MIKVITYGTFDKLHIGHIRLLERAKKLGDYLIVGVTSDGYDVTRGKINNHDSLMTRVEAVKSLGIADDIIVEEYEGQKIDDIKKYGVDIFTVGDDWKGKFDYLSEFCKVVYLSRTKGISSTELRSNDRNLSLFLKGVDRLKGKYESECAFANGINVSKDENDYNALFLFNHPKYHYEEIKKNLENGKHVLCESPICLSEKDFIELRDLANSKQLILMDFIKTAYATAYERLLVLLKTGKIGKIVSVDATCTSLKEGPLDIENNWCAFYDWAPTALLPIFQILGTNFVDVEINSRLESKKPLYDGFSQINFRYKGAVATAKVATSAKSEGQLIITGTKGYAIVPSPWWKTDYFEIRYESLNETKKYFYQLEGEGIRNEIVSFAKSVGYGKDIFAISDDVSLAILKVMEKFAKGDINILENE